jgi:hypothetical protein
LGVALELRFGANVERLHNPGIHRCNDIHGTVQIVFTDAGFPCVRKTAFHSRLAIAHYGDGESHEHFFAFAQITYGVGIAVELTEIGSFRHGSLLWIEHGLSL